MPRQKLKVGDIFEISLESGEAGFGQVLSIEPDALNSVGCALWEPSSASFGEAMKGRPVSILLVTPDLLKKGYWRIISNCDPVIPQSKWPYESLRANRWVGAKVIGSGIVREFMQACAGLSPWDDFASPDYLDGLLAPGVSRPQRAVLKPCP